MRADEIGGCKTLGMQKAKPQLFLRRGFALERSRGAVATIGRSGGGQNRLHIDGGRSVFSDYVEPEELHIVPASTFTANQS